MLDGAGWATRRYPGHEITLLANTPAEREAVAAQGLDALFCNGAAFLSPEPPSQTK